MDGKVILSQTLIDKSGNVTNQGTKSNTDQTNNSFDLSNIPVWIWVLLGIVILTDRK